MLLVDRRTEITGRGEAVKVRVLPSPIYGISLMCTGGETLVAFVPGATMRDATSQRTVVPQRQSGNRRLLIIVSRAHPAQCTYLKHAFGPDAVDVILDRRMGARRQRKNVRGVERRFRDRRHRDITKDIEKFDWAVVRR